MSSLHNLKDASRLLPSWAGPSAMTALIVVIYGIAYRYYQDRPHDLIAMATTTAIVLSLCLAAAIAFTSILKARTGEVAAAVTDGFTRGLNFSWASSAVALVVFLSAGSVQRLISDNLSMSIAGVAALALLGVGYWATKPKDQSNASSNGGLPAVSALSIPDQFRQSTEQLPAFQVTIADLNRLIIHQAGRAIAYKGSNCLIDDAFSIELDVNARTSKIFANTNLINTTNFLYWRMHMLLMGSAAERVLRNTTSEAALDDMHNFDDLASRYLTLREDRTFNSRPINEHEAALKAGRINMLRKHVWSRCIAAAEMNKRVLVDLVKLMRVQACLSYGDIKGLLERVEMPDDFPVAEFDSEEVMVKALLAFDDAPEVTLEGVRGDTVDEADRDDFRPEGTKAQTASRQAANDSDGVGTAHA